MPTNPISLNVSRVPEFPSPNGPEAEASPNTLSGQQRFHQRAQRDRGIAFTVAAIFALIAHVSGFVVLETTPALGLLAFAYATSLLFFYLHGMPWSRRNTERIAAAWLACDIGLVTSMIYMTGGVASPWFLWYLACAGAAAFVGGLRWVIVVAATSAVAYLGVLTAMGEIRGVDSAFYYAAAQITFLFGASSSLVLGTAKLRADHGKVKRLQDRETIKVWELSLLSAELDAANDLLRETTVTDPLTGLHNRRYLQDRMSGRRDRRGGANPGVTGVLLIDLDHFKSVNDTYGHQSGDRVLCHVAELLRHCVRSGDHVVRWGGEEFLVVLPGSGADRTMEIVERILHAMRSELCALNGGVTLRLTCSIGWSVMPSADTADSGGSWDNAVQRADRALYMAKAAGRDRACTVPPSFESEEGREEAATPFSQEPLGPRRFTLRA
jgi:diguanylate cyclase (GGDEF)-like protein